MTVIPEHGPPALATRSGGGQVEEVLSAEQFVELSASIRRAMNGVLAGGASLSHSLATR